MERSRKSGWLHSTALAGGVGKKQRSVEANLIGNTRTGIEVFEIGTATQRNVLAIIDMSVVRQNV